MTKVIFRRQAVADLQSIRDYYLPLDAAALNNILDDIEHGIALLRDYPRAGPEMQERPVRWIVSRRYGYKITYRTDGQLVEIIGIFRFQNRQV